MKEEAEKLLKQAEYELDASRILLDNFKYSAAAFHSQQATEMALKALHVEKRGKHLQVHDLGILAIFPKMPSKIFKLCEQLSKTYSETRYFDSRTDRRIPYQQYDEDKAKEKYHAAEEVIEWIKEKLNPSTKSEDSKTN